MHFKVDSPENKYVCFHFFKDNAVEHWIRSSNSHKISLSSTEPILHVSKYTFENNYKKKSTFNPGFVLSIKPENHPLKYIFIYIKYILNYYFKFTNRILIIFIV